MTCAKLFSCWGCRLHNYNKPCSSKLCRCKPCSKMPWRRVEQTPRCKRNSSKYHRWLPRWGNKCLATWDRCKIHRWQWVPKPNCNFNKLLCNFRFFSALTVNGGPLKSAKILRYPDIDDFLDWARIRNDHIFFNKDVIHHLSHHLCGTVLVPSKCLMIQPLFKQQRGTLSPSAKNQHTFTASQIPTKLYHIYVYIHMYVSVW